MIYSHHLIIKGSVSSSVLCLPLAHIPARPGLSRSTVAFFVIEEANSFVAAVSRLRAFMVHSVPDTPDQSLDAILICSLIVVSRYRAFFFFFKFSYF